MPRRRKIKSWLGTASALLLAARAPAQGIFHSPSPTAATSPFSGFGGTKTSDEPLRNVPLVEKTWPELSLSARQLSVEASQALAIAPEKWKHAETENFILHYRRVTEAQKVAREVEYDLWFVARNLGATKDQYQKKSHVFIFEDEAEWQKFLSIAKAPDWFASFALGDDLFLNVRRAEVAGQFDSHLVAHETTHAVVARLYAQPWPVWLSEGFAEYMGSASVAARKNQTVKRHERALSFATLPLEQLTATTKYPEDPIAVAQLYESSEKLVRFLMTELPKEQFPKFIDAVLSGQSLSEAIPYVYGAHFKTYDDFTKQYEKFSK